MIPSWSGDRPGTGQVAHRRRRRVGRAARCPVAGWHVGGEDSSDVEQRGLFGAGRGMRFSGTGRPRLPRSVVDSYSVRTMPRSCRIGTTSSRKRRHWPGWSTPTLSPSRARPSNHSWIWSATVAGRAGERGRPGAEMNSTVCRRVKSLSRREPGDLLRAGAEAALGVHEGLLRERGVQVVLAEVVPGERAAEPGQGAVEVPVPGLQVQLDLAGLAIGVSHVDRDARHDDDLSGSRPLAGRAGLQVVVERLALLDGRPRR